MATVFLGAVIVGGVILKQMMRETKQEWRGL